MQTTGMWFHSLLLTNGTNLMRISVQQQTNIEIYAVVTYSWPYTLTYSDLIAISTKKEFVLTLTPYSLMKMLLHKKYIELSVSKVSH